MNITVPGRLISVVIPTKTTPIMSATNDKIRGNWNQIKGGLKQKWGVLTDNDLTYQEGQEDELVGRIQEKTGQTKQAIKDFIDGL